MKNQSTLTLHLTLEEVNTILTALGDRPYVQVYPLIQKIQAEAGAQIKNENELDTSVAAKEMTKPGKM